MTTLPANMKLYGNDMSAQSLIKQPKMVVKYGLLRKKNNTLNFGRWPRRFVILRESDLNVYVDENSKAPKSSFSLQGYNTVKRVDTKGQDWAFAVHPAHNTDPSKIKTFSCISNSERLDWMKAIKRQMYVANGMTIPDTTMSEKLRSISISEEEKDEYYLIEKAIDISDEMIPEMTSDSEEESSDSGSGGSKMGKTSRSFSLPQKDQTSPSSSAGKFRKTSTSAIFESEAEKRANSKPVLRSHSDAAPPVPPPRYSDVMEDCPNYVNIPGLEDETYEIPDDFVVHTLEALCTIHEENPDREELNQRLLAKRHPGTYLIRKSRKGDEKVLAFLAEGGQVKEYKIYEVNSKWTIDRVKEFKDINDLLKHYSTMEKLPKTNIALKKGFFES
ncbi:SH3 domain-binding protein 2 [Biomphalaria pfeifferi]|uniref:SH3 domain-binding protein 2 n=1 Tax=Biomphalaria pfeifferi TaxID=112525 RepID=A0AAD8BU83_BIOPF|nr:SH3 domain-binding protein 2 [Biomphalaria pfeifferi]